MIGSSLSHFNISAKLGEGGMGEVYRADDTKLGREVAIKVLPEAVAQDPERLARFEREAKVLASLNHANIAAIYSLESAQAGTEAGETIRFLVMELVEGEDLAERLDRGAISIDQALPMAHQIAQALEAAHESGVIHRDLKPANVKVKPDGQVKVLDFGLAKALDPQETGSAVQTLSMSPTLTAQMTQAGVLLGTAAYMSPEQARGQEADKRADIWAFGVLLWEMLTGHRLFVGDTVSDTLAEVLKTEPDPSTLPTGLPQSIRQMLARCLTRDTRQRLRDIGEARIALQQARDGGAEEAVEEGPTGSKSRGRTLLFAACLALITGLGGWLLARSTSEAPKRDQTYSFSINEPEGILSGSFAISPDGAHLAFLARGEGEIEQLWIRQLESFSARPLPNTEGARWPFWSPDSRTIAFFVGYELRRIELDSSEIRKITDYPGAIGGTWGPEDTILIGTSNGPIHRVAASGGAAPRPALALSEGEGPGVSHGWPVFLQDSGRYFFLSDGAGESR
jgi:serine/threonine protein kinase